LDQRQQGGTEEKTTGDYGNGMLKLQVANWPAKAFDALLNFFWTISALM